MLPFDGPGGTEGNQGSDRAATDQTGGARPSVVLPKGGGAIRGVDEKFKVNPANGSGQFSIPLPLSKARGFGPDLTLNYDSGSGNGLFGIGWQLDLPSITRKTSKGNPQYNDPQESDVFLLAGAEDLVPVLTSDEVSAPRFERRTSIEDVAYRISHYRPRIEGSFVRVERWFDTNNGTSHWRTISRDNVTTIFGKDENTRVSDPANSKRTFSWLIQERYDDKGNAVHFGYKEEDLANVSTQRISEAHRFSNGLFVNRHIKRIRYGNVSPHSMGDDLSDREDWLFDVVFDYGEQHNDTPTPIDTAEWHGREDPFSTYRAGFEQRTYRLCQRILIFHRRPELPGPLSQPFLVRSLDLSYGATRYGQIDNSESIAEDRQIGALLASVTQRSYRRDDEAEEDRYSIASLPPLEFTYSEARFGNTVSTLDDESLEQLPVGVGRAYQFADIEGEGLSSILHRDRNAWHTKPSFGEGRFGPVRPVRSRPSVGTGTLQLADMAGDGQLDVIDYSGPSKGFYERTTDERWEAFRAFRTLPNVGWGDSNLRFVDLTGDGKADLLITENEVVTWHESLGEEGFENGGQAAALAMNSEGSAPRLVLNDRAQSIFLADMSGDGLPDIVRIRNGEVAYWPNIGYGRFAAQVLMDGSPWFDQPDQFDPSRLRLADIDGSGITDILYLGRDTISFWLNRAGNGWAPKRELTAHLPANQFAQVSVHDLLGNGTACLVWSSPLPTASREPLRYIDLMSGQKPHLMIKSVNNLGAETQVTYRPSTKFYLEDRAAGQPWLTRLPFPVHVISKTRTIDHVSRTVFTSRYAYHHGYFDGAEREFRGFGMVEQWDTDSYAVFDEEPDDLHWDPENIGTDSDTPPVRTKTWFHTGAWAEAGRVSLQFKDDYFREPDLSDADADALLLPDTVLPTDLSPVEAREAVRALKGSMLRQEVYADDGSEKSQVPYAVTEQNFTVRRLQRKGKNRHGIFFTHPRETFSFHYEREASDPRVSHQITLKVDNYGNVERSLALGYARRSAPDADPETGADLDPQRKLHVTLSENTFTNAIDDPEEYPDDYRTPLPADTRTYELVDFEVDVFEDGTVRDTTRRGLTPVRFSLVQALDLPNLSGARLLSAGRHYYRADDLGQRLDLGQSGRLALPSESFKLAITRGQREAVFGDRVQPERLPELHTLADPLVEGGYVDLDGDGDWWIPSGQAYFSPDEDDTPADELAYAQDHFFLPHRFVDPFGAQSTIRYDDARLLPLQTRDAHGNTTTAGEIGSEEIQSSIDYRLLQPTLVTDANGNRTAVAFDALGLVVGVAQMGKRGAVRGDTLDDFQVDLSDDEVSEVIDTPLGQQARDLLADASQRFFYDVWRYARAPEERRPAVVMAVAREVHSDATSPVQVSLSYSDGFGREIQKKAQAEPGPLEEGGPAVDPRWVASGWTIFNNKGKPVRQYEPFFDDTPAFRFGRRFGVSPTLLYDPLGRVVATLHPNHTYEKVVFDAWRQESWDTSDTVLIEDPAEDQDVGDFIRGLPWWSYTPTWYGLRTDPNEALQKWPDVDENGEPIVGNAERRAAERVAAEKTEAHAGTYTVSHLDSLGRPFSVVAHIGRPDGDPETRTELDIEGRPLAIIDARQNTVMDYRLPAPNELMPAYDLTGRLLYQNSMDTGERRMLPDIAGQPLFTWDARGHVTRTRYDALRRPLEVQLKEVDARTVVIDRTHYGDHSDLTREEEPATQAANLRGQVIEHADQSGLTRNLVFDFKGNILATRQRLARFEGQQTALLAEAPTVDWSQDVAFEDEVFETETAYDALNRPIYQRAPDGSIARPGYNEAGLLERVDVHLRSLIAGVPLPEEVDEAALDNRLADAVTAAGAPTAFVTNIDYDAKGQRSKIIYGNGTTTRYSYEPETHRLLRMHTWRNRPNERPLEPDSEPQRAIQDLNYTYDPASNITEIRDDAQQTTFFRNTPVSATTTYTYDPLYRLIEARGREHLGLAERGQRRPPRAPTFSDVPRLGNRDDTAMGLYIETYRYDDAGNIEEFSHHTNHGGTAPDTGWTRTLTYEETSNRLATSVVAHSHEDPTRFAFTHNAHGSLQAMAHLPLMRWNHAEQLVATAKQVRNGDAAAETTYYVYGADGQRARKITYAAENGRGEQKRKSERIYLGGFEIYREFASNGTKEMERQTLHVMDGENRIALVETKTRDSGRDIDEPVSRQRYQHGNHLGSVVLELDDIANVISYEEYLPYGATSYQAKNPNSEVSVRRYRYTGMERDEETGLNYHTARYYALWLGGWVSADPIGIEGGINLYVYAKSNPIIYSDVKGQEARLIIDESNHTITLQTTVHLYARNRQERRELQNAAQQAQEFFNNPNVATDQEVNKAKNQGYDIPNRGTTFTDTNNQTWNIRFDIAYEVHNRRDTPITHARSNAQGDRTHFYDVDQDRTSQDNIQAGDNILELKTRRQLDELGGSVRTLSTGPIQSNMLGELFATRVPGGAGARAIWRNEVARRLVHETGHHLGFQDRYDPGIAQFMGGTYSGFSSDFMGNDNLLQGVVINPLHISELGAFAMEIHNQTPPPQSGVSTYLLSGHIDDTRSGRMQVRHSDYNQAQIDLRQARGRAVFRQRMSGNPRRVLPHIPERYVNYR